MGISQLQGDQVLPSTGESPNADPGYVSCTTSATRYTKGAWVTLFAATAGEGRALVLYISVPVGDSAALVDFAVGAGGSEVVIIPNIAGNAYYTIPISIPVGSRLAIRASNLTLAAAREVRVTATVMEK